MDIIPLFSVSELADDFTILQIIFNYHWLLIVIICVCNNNLHYGTKVYNIIHEYLHPQCVCLQL